MSAARGICIAAVFSASLASRAWAVDADAIDAALVKSRSYLLTRPDFVKNGNWETGEPKADVHYGGRTALMTYALLASGVPASDPRLQPPLEFLKKVELVSHYAIGLRALVWTYLPSTPATASLVQREYRLLLKGIETSAAQPSSGLFDYTAEKRGRIDLSVSQYGVLGLWACARLNAEVAAGPSFNLWKMIDVRWKKLQDATTGGWAYTGDSRTTASMTAAGVATLYITQDHLGAVAATDELGNARDPAIDRGVAFLAGELPKLVAPGEIPNRFYTLYGVERVGVAGGYKFIGDVDWFDAGSKFLLASQSADGSWSGEFSDEICTAFATLFLSRGREPLVMSKLAFTEPAADGSRKPGRWNQRGRDVANATDFVGGAMERPFNWQILDLDVASVRDLHDAPIAYLSTPAREPPKLDDASLAKLRDYVETGGMLIVNLEKRPATTQPAMPEPPLLKSLFPLATFRAVPADSPIFRNQQFRTAAWRVPPRLFEVSNGVRTLALVSADDAGDAWQNAERRQRAPQFEWFADAYQYAIDKEFAKEKGRSSYVPLDESLPTARTVRVARLKFDGNWDPEPGGWRQMRALLRRDGVDVQTSPVEPSIDPLDGFDVAHLTGTGEARFTQKSVQAMKAFIDRGGLLLIDAAGGDETFAQSVARQLRDVADVFGTKARPMPASASIFQRAGEKPIEFKYRTYSIAKLGLMTTPRLRGLQKDGKWTVIYSPDDLSAGMVGMPRDGIVGYAPETAQEIVRRALLSRAK